MSAALKSKFSVDLFWNIAGFGISGVIGILLNILIIKYYDSASLGVFNQIYAIYILLSQLAVGGVHLAVQVYIPKHSQEITTTQVILQSSLLLALITSFIVIIISFVFNKLPGIILDSKGVENGFKYVIPGLLFFSLNKVLLSFHNGLRRMKVFAFFQMMRFILMLLLLITFIYLKVDSDFLASILAIAELILFVMILLYSFKYISFKCDSSFNYWFVTNFKFGNRALFGNFLMDINTRVDVFLLGIFLSDKIVGVYSFAATFAEGFAQLPMIFRNNINPILAKCHATKSKHVTERVISKNIKYFYKILATLAILSILIFPLVLWAFKIKDDFYTIWLIYAILTGGTAIASGYLPFQMILNQFGLPGKQTFFISLVFLVNVAFNILLIPILGIAGSAIGTAISFISQIIFIKYLVKKFAAIKI